MTTSWPRIFLLYAIGVVSAAQLGLVPPLVPTLQRDLGMSLAAAGLAVSVVTLIGAVLGLPAGGWSERIGHARALWLGIAIMAAASAFCAATESAPMLLAGRALAGVGYLLVVVAGPSLIAAMAEPRHHPFTLSLWGTFVPVGIALAGLGTASLIDHWDWREVFLLDAGLLAAVLAAAILAIRPPPVRHAATTAPASLALLRPSVPMAIAFFCFALLFLAVAGLLPEYLVERRGQSPAAAGRIAAIVTAFGIAGSLAAGWTMRRSVRPGPLAATGMISSTAVAAFCLATSPPLPVAVAGFALSFALGGLVPAAAFASVPLVAGEARAIGPINGLIAQAGSLGSLAGPPLLALWTGLAGWSTSAVPLLAVATIGSACALATTNRRSIG